MTPLSASLLLGAGALLALGWGAGLAAVLLTKRPPKGEVLAATGLSLFQTLGGAGCVFVFGSIWAGELSARAGGTAPVSGRVLLWSGLLALMGMAVLWTALVCRVWCGPAALTRRDWRGRLLTVPYGEIAGGRASFSYDDAVIPWGDRTLVLDRSLPGFDRVAALLERQGVDLSEMPPKRAFLSRKEKRGGDPFSKRR